MRRIIQTQGFMALTGKMGVLVQPRTKGKGHGSTSRAFYARTGFVTHIIEQGRRVSAPIEPEEPGDEGNDEITL